VADGIKSTLASLKADLPPGVTITSFYDQSEIVLESQHSVIESLIVGGLLALFVLMLFLGNLRTAAIVLILLPLTIVITFALMKLLGQTMNIMTLGALAIALGLVIDDGIVVVENMFSELESGRSRPDAIAAGLKAITPAMIGSSLTTMAAFLPLTFLNDLTGQFFGPLALVMVATLGVSLALALLLTPLLAGWLLPKSVAHDDGRKPSVPARILGFFPRQFDKIVRVYTHILRWCLAHRAIVLVLLIPVALGTYFLFKSLATGFFPEFDEGGFTLDYQLPPGTSLAESSHVAGKIESVFAYTPEVAAWSRRTGAQLGFDITTQNAGDMSVRLKSNRSRDINAVMNDIREQIEAKYPAAQVDFTQTLQDQIGDIAGDAPSPVQIKIYGPDEPTLESLAGQIDGILQKQEYIVDDNNGIVHSNPQAMLDVDTQRAQRYGLTADDITQAAQSALQGTEPTHVQQGEEAVGVRVQLAHPGQTLGPSLLPQIPVASPVTNGNVPLSEVAKVEVLPGDPQVTRENQRQMIAVTARLSGRDLGSATADIQRLIKQQIKLPTGYEIEYGGLYASQQQSFSELGTALGIAVLFVFTLLVFQFRAIRQAVALLMAALLSLLGVLLALKLTGTQLNISSFTGAIMIVGIITENGIVLFDFFNRLRAEDPKGDLAALMARAGTERLRPILMTTIGAILALLPLALGLGAGAALQKPLAIAVVGGLLVSTLFTLIVAPVIYVVLERGRTPSS
jgi:multidrug efflux pump subunit AcrB